MLITLKSFSLLWLLCETTHVLALSTPPPPSSSSSTTTLPPNVFPSSTRQALLQTQKYGRRGSYSAVGWSNRLGTVLTPVSVPGVYTADRPFYWNGIDVGCRMTMIELQQQQSDDDKPVCWVHSPVGLDGPLLDALAQHDVRYVVSPNYEHVKFAPQWAHAFPQAEMWGCPGLAAMKPNVPWKGEIPFGMRPPNNNNNHNHNNNNNNDQVLPWDDSSEIQSLHIDTEVNPFTGKPFFNEVVFYHVPSKTLLTTDLYWNYPSGDGVTNSFLRQQTSLVVEDTMANGPWELAPSVPPIPWGSRLWKVGMDKLFQPFYVNFMTQDQERFRREILRVLLEEWDIETVIPAHGDIVRGKELIRSILRQHFGLEDEQKETTTK